MKHEIIIDYVTIDSIKPYPGNTKKHPDSEIEKLAEMIDAYGFDQPIVVDKNMVIIKGHGRLLAHKKLGSELIPIVMRDDLTPALVKASRIADNKSNESELDLDLLAIEFDELKEMDFDLDLLGFNEDLEFNIKDYDPDTIEDVSSDLPGAMALKIDMSFPSKLKYGIPELRLDMLAEIPKNFKTWAGKDATTDDGVSHYLWHWRTDSLKQYPKERLAIGFYTDDYRFDMVWDKPAECVTKMLNLGVALAINPNFSLWYGVPEAIHIFNCYKSKWIGRYMQEAGIAIIPDVNWASESSFEFCLLGIPKNPPAIAFQLQTLKKEELQRALYGVKKSINELEPKSILIYGHTMAHDIMDKVDFSGRVHFLESRTALRRKVMNGE